MAKLATAREARQYGPALTVPRWEYINAGVYVLETLLLSAALRVLCASSYDGGVSRPGSGARGGCRGAGHRGGRERAPRCHRLPRGARPVQPAARPRRAPRARPQRGRLCPRRRQRGIPARPGSCRHGVPNQLGIDTAIRRRPLSADCPFFVLLADGSGEPGRAARGECAAAR